MATDTQSRCASCGQYNDGRLIVFRGQPVCSDKAECRQKLQRLTRSAQIDLETRTVNFADFQIRSSATSAGEFEGYANKFGVLDTYDTRFVTGAWSRGGLDGDSYPLLWMHSPYDPIGSLRGAEDSAGLLVEGRWDNTDEGKRARGRAESSAQELSVGFKTLERAKDDSKGIYTAQLREVSQVTNRWGSTPGARLLSVRMGSPDRRAIAGSYEDLQEDLREAVEAKVGLDGSGMGYVYLMATFPDRVVYCVSNPALGMDGDDDDCFSASYSSEGGAITIGDPTPVSVEQVIQPRSQGERGLEQRKARLAMALRMTVPVVGRALRAEQRATWDTAYINDLPDSAFLYIEDGGEKDEDGKTTPRSLRHFPYKDINGKVDLPHLRNALARIPQSDLPSDAKDGLTKKAQKLLDDTKGSD